MDKPKFENSALKDALKNRMGKIKAVREEAPPPMKPGDIKK